MTTAVEDQPVGTDTASEAAALFRSQVQLSTNGQETWRNSIRGRVVVRRTGLDGRERHDLIRSGATFTVTPDQRREQQAAAANERLDMFINGQLQPVILCDGHEDNESILSNPNHLPEADTATIFRLKGDKFARRIAAIDNPAAIDRLLELAEDPRNGAFVAQLRILERRHDQIDHTADHVRADVSAGERTAPAPGAFKPVTPS